MKVLLIRSVFRQLAATDCETAWTGGRFCSQNTRNAFRGVGLERSRVAKVHLSNPTVYLRSLPKKPGCRRRATHELKLSALIVPISVFASKTRRTCSELSCSKAVPSGYLWPTRLAVGETCQSAVPPSSFSRRFDRDREGASAE